MTLAIYSNVERFLGFVLAGAVSLASMPVAAAGPAKDAEEPPPTQESQPAATEVSGTVALMRFSGPEPSQQIRGTMQQVLEQEGLTVKGVALDVSQAATKVKCRGFRADKDPGLVEIPDDCLAAIGKWLTSNPKTTADYIAYGQVADVEGVTQAQIVVYDIAKAERVADNPAVVTSDDLILPIVLPRSSAKELARHIVAPEPATEAEKKILAQLDEPPKTAEELAAERRKIEEAEAKAGQFGSGDVDLGGIGYDLKKDFKDFCRTGPRNKRDTKDDPRDWRPKCDGGTFWGYWQPRTWVALGLTSGAFLTTAALYAVALAKRGPYKDAVDAVEAYEEEVGGDASGSPYLTSSDDATYRDLALDVSQRGHEMRNFAIAGDVALGVSVLLTGILGIIIWQDRRDAKRALTEEKRLRALSGVRIGPMLGRGGTQGAALGFQF